MAVVLVVGWRSAVAQPKRPGGPARVVEGFTMQEVARGVTAGTAMEIAPDGRVLVCEQTGVLRVIEKDKLLERPFLQVKVDATWERGLIGVTVDPDFGRNQFVYVTYVSPTPYPHHVVSRFVVSGNEVVAGSEKVLLEGDNQQKMRGTIKNGHQGGAIHFGRGGKLFVSIGEQTSNDPAQDMDTFLGKILRINADGSIPVENPFYATAEGKYRAIWALGCRNVFGFAVEPGTGRLFLNDVGGAREEINVSSKGGENFGWPTVEHGVNSKGKFVDAIYSYPFASIVGGDFCTAEKCGAWPREYWGKYFFMDYVHGWIKFLDPERPGDVKEFASGVPFGTDLRFGRDGALYVLVRDMWVNEKSFFKAGTGFVLKITPK
ncbi:MAG TPA: PQQ-dependent sugar dehydrogenase [Tepidisphaeraceae bacterium]|nr:PQQ-dependent sugar dehydrogenase [Tepidisphaeraceae bacterium]